MTTTRLFDGMNGGPYSIGELIALVHDEVPELTVSKVRFLEGQGLINPRRSPAGYRMFSDDEWPGSSTCSASSVTTSCRSR